MVSDHRLPWVIDIEASGLHADAYPIQIAYGNGDVLHAHYIKPLDDWTHWDEVAEEKHGISREYLIKYGLPAEEVAKLMKQHLQGSIMYSDAVGFDHSWCQRLFESTDDSMDFEIGDYWLILGKQLPCEIKSHQALNAWIHALMERAKASVTNHFDHRADSDVRVLLKMLQLSKEEKINE